MIEEPHTDETPRQKGIVEHRCEHPDCAAWGAFGYSRGKLTPSTWYCFRHREDGERLLSRNG